MSAVAIMTLIATFVIVLVATLSGEVTVKSRVRPQGASDAATVTYAAVTITEGLTSCKADGDVNYAEPGWVKSLSWRTNFELGEPCSPEIVGSLLDKLAEQFDLKSDQARALFDQAAKNIKLHYGLIK